MRPLCILLFSTLLMLHGLGQDLSFKSLSHFSKGGVAYAEAVLTKGGWALVDTTKTDQRSAVTLVFTKDTINLAKQVIVVTDGPEGPSLVSYRLSDRTLFEALHAEAVALGFTAFDSTNTGNEQVRYLIRDSLEVASYHSLADSTGRIAAGYMIHVSSFVHWLTSLLPPVNPAGWTRASRLAFLEQCFKPGQLQVGSLEARRYCSCMLQKIEGLYQRESDAERISFEEMFRLAKECTD